MKNEHTNWKTYCLEHAGEELRAEAVAYLQRDPETNKQVEQLIQVRKLMSLKQYEQPHPAVLNRCLRAVNTRIEARNVSWITRLREWMSPEETPGLAWAYGTAVLVLLVGGGLLWRGAPAGNTASVAIAPVEATPLIEPVMLADAMDPVATNEEITLVTSDFPAFEKPIIMLRQEIPPNSGRMTFGTEATVPVSFEY